MSEFDYGTGRRKNATARTRLYAGNGASKSTVVKWKITSPARPFR